jgi:hypothetical protein
MGRVKGFSPAALSVTVVCLFAWVPGSMAAETPTGPGSRASDANARDADAALQLDPITVTPWINPLDEELLRLRRMLDAGAPCLGCDATAIKAQDSAAESIMKYILLPTAPLEPTEADKMGAAVRCQESGPEMDFLCAY